jgi:NAD+ kinase
MKPSRIRRALIVYKDDDAFRALSGRFPWAKLPKKIKKTAVSPRLTLEKVRNALDKKNISYKILPRSRLKSAQGYDLLITVGGDGTFLDASHYCLPRAVLFGVNSDPRLSHGAFCAANGNTFEKTLSALLKGRASVLPLHRLQVKINGRRLPVPALNDVLFANRSPAGTSRYILRIGNRWEEQKSSGIWIATGAGSTGALHSAGGRPFPKHSREIQYVVREPFQKRGKRLIFFSGKLKAGQSFQIYSTMSRAAVFLDGAHLHYDVRYGDLVEIKIAEKPVRAVIQP